MNGLFDDFGHWADAIKHGGNRPGSPATRDAVKHVDELADAEVAKIVAAQQAQRNGQMLLWTAAGIGVLLLLTSGRR